MPLSTTRPMHEFLSRGGSMGRAPSPDPIIVYAWFIRKLERLIEELEYHEVRAGKLGVQVWYKDGAFRESFAALEAPSDRFDMLLDVVRVCLGIREVHDNTLEGIQTGLRNYPRIFWGVSKRHLAQYVAIFLWSYNSKGCARNSFES